MINSLSIDGRQIGSGYPPYIIAEISGNHNGDFDRAVAMIKMAAGAGADAVKLQTYTADTITIDHDGPGFIIKEGLWKGRKLYDLYDEAHTPWDWHARLFEIANDLGITIFSSPFDLTAVALLESLGAPAYKIASFEAVDLALIECAAKTRKPLIISTGMANEDEIREALEAAQNARAGGVILLHCVSGYPTPTAEANVANIVDMAKKYSVPVGLSDHSLGMTVAVAAVALGACVIEKHITLSRADGGPDSAFSLEPDELAELVRQCRDAHAAVGQIDYGLKQSEAGMKELRRSLFAVMDIKKDEMFTDKNVRSIRPGTGMAPKNLPSVLGGTAAVDIAYGTPLEREHVKGG